MNLVASSFGYQRQSALSSLIPVCSTFGSFKILVLIALIIFGLVVDLGGARLEGGGHDRIGFRFWGSQYGPMGHAPMGPHETYLNNHDTNRFLGWWATMGKLCKLNTSPVDNIYPVGTWFSYMGIELVRILLVAQSSRSDWCRLVSWSERLQIRESPYQKVSLLLRIVPTMLTLE